MSEKIIAIIGLGYVGLPLAVAFSRQHKTIAFDIDEVRISDLRLGIDRTKEVYGQDLEQLDHICLTTNANDLGDANIYIVTVPTPVSSENIPDLTPLAKASALVGNALKRGDLVIFESTVYPGTTEDFCVPILESHSGLIFNVDFFCGYSPERINPGDNERKLENIVKVTSGSTADAANLVDSLYAAIIPAGTHKAPSIEVAEAAKVIENTQRDINIALMNELSLIFDKLGLRTADVLAAARTKWNFLDFTPGLVGGHCIGVDPYYLTFRAKQVGVEPEVILAGRRVNDSMGKLIAQKTLKQIKEKHPTIEAPTVLVLGLTFKENCPDLRNSKVKDVIDELMGAGASVFCHDTEADQSDAASFSSANYIRCLPEEADFDAIILCVPHQQYVALGPENIRQLGKPDAFFYDIKSTFSAEQADAAL